MLRLLSFTWLSFAVFLLIQAGCDSRPEYSDTNLPPRMTPDGNLVPASQEFARNERANELLNDYEDAFGFRIRPPKGYVRQEMPSMPGGKAVAWLGSPRDDGTAPMVQLSVLSPPEGEELLSLTDWMIKSCAGVQRRRSNFTPSAISFGMINRVQFANQTWVGSFTAEDKKEHLMRGTIYVAVLENNQFIQLLAQDVDPYCIGSLESAEASIISFRND